MPPLRERKDDIVPLANFFIRRFAAELKKKIDGLDADAQKMLMRYNWPGNIRELENAIERAMLLTEGRAIAARRPAARRGRRRPADGRDQAAVVKIPPTGIPLEEIERHALVEALKMSNWVQKDAAELLSISPRVMNYKIKTLGIEFPRGRRAAPRSRSSRRRPSRSTVQSRGRRRAGVSQSARWRRDDRSLRPAGGRPGSLSAPDDLQHIVAESLKRQMAVVLGQEPQ